MKTLTKLRPTLLLASLAALALSAGPALAQSHAGGGHFGGPAGGHYSGHPGYGYPGWHGGYYGGWGWRGGYYGGWGWGGLGLGLYFAALPPYYATYWWGGVPYYYADNTYYVYDGNLGQYQTIAPPQELQQQVAAQGPPPGQAPVGTDLMAYPAKGQSEEQQRTDKFECHRWAASQTGFDPTQGSSASATPVKRSDYMRAQAACLEGRGYSVK
jgi:hypothetical protein